MSITVISEVWRALKLEIDENNLPDAAESLINVLVDNDYDTAEIKEAFRRETVVMEALRDYNSQYEDEEYEEEEDEDYEDDEDNW
jgi:hypothetical protein